MKKKVVEGLYFKQHSIANNHKTTRNLIKTPCEMFCLALSVRVIKSLEAYFHFTLRKKNNPLKSNLLLRLWTIYYVVSSQ